MDFGLGASGWFTGQTDLQNSLTDLDPPEALANLHEFLVEQLGGFWVCRQPGAFERSRRSVPTR